MDHFEGIVTGHVSAPPEAVFELVTDVGRLPEWNRCIASIVEAPAKPAPGAEWVVKIRVPGLPAWNSRSRVEEYDPDGLRFVYRSQSDDGNPSYAVWTWALRPEGDGTLVTVGWEGNPKTFWRKLLFAPLRRRQLQGEVAASIAALEGTLSTTS
ncbi:MAG: SRPBCC family protein [Actinomycetota bacterium]